MNKPTLPGIPSELIRLAVADLEAVEALPERFRVDMDDWHMPNGDRCEVCLAGSVMAMTLCVPDWMETGAKQLPESIGDRLESIDSFRIGMVKTGCQILGRTLPPQIADYRNVAYYSDDPAQFKTDMRKLADDLEAVGL